MQHTNPLKAAGFPLSTSVSSISEATTVLRASSSSVVLRLPSFQASLLLDVHFWKSYDFASTWANSLTNDMTVTRHLWFLHTAICTSVVFNSNISAHLLPGARECHGDACTSHCSLGQWACTQGASAPGVRTDYLRCVPTEMVGERKVT